MKPKRHPVTEIFGPTVQGEGVDQGLPVHFIRLGGCDYRCTWCDTPHAVLPARVREAPWLVAEEIVDRVLALGGAPTWVVISGGNPALHRIEELIDRLHAVAFRVAVETQGTRWPVWLESCDRLCLSPKGPSSGMAAGRDVDVNLARASDANHRLGPGWAFVKVVVFDDADYEFARRIHEQAPALPFFLSAGNDAGQTVASPDRIDHRSQAEIRADLLERSRWLVERVVQDPAMRDVQVQSQYHVLMWGNERGR
jgi:7-carboxy-7-deazaguanine synthase